MSGDAADLVDVETGAGLVRARWWPEPGGAAWVSLRGPVEAAYRLPRGGSARDMRAAVVEACLRLGLDVLRVSGEGLPAPRRPPADGDAFGAELAGARSRSGAAPSAPEEEDDVERDLFELGTRDGRASRVSLRSGAAPALLVRGAESAEIPFEAGEAEGPALRTAALAALCRALPGLDPARVSLADEPTEGLERLLDATRAVAADRLAALRALGDGSAEAALVGLGWALLEGEAPEGARRWVSPGGAAHAITVPKEWGDFPERTWEALVAAGAAAGAEPTNLLAALLADPPPPARPRRLARCTYKGPARAVCCGRGCDKCVFVDSRGWRCVDCGAVGATPAEVAHEARCLGAP